jgi:NAD(P)-dependent dehydrogenase (short-subunit alcohol dehydrogenase family)
VTTTSDMIARQRPLSTQFGYRTTAAEVISGHDLTGRRAIVTGGYSGLGLATVTALIGAGATVTVPARRPAAATAVLAGMVGVQVAAVDLSDLDSVAAFTAAQRAAGRPVDLVINAAGVMASPEQRTPQGWESQFGTNHLGHFALVGGVAKLLAQDARVVAYSSVAHYRSPVLFEDVNFDRTPYDPWVAYGQSKTANALFAVGLDARAQARSVHAYSVHPGGIMTDLQRHLPHDELVARQWVDAEGNPNPLFKTPAEGAATALWAATATELTTRGGVYCEDCGVKGVVPSDHTDLTTGGAKQWAIDTDAADRLWELSVAATGLNPFEA